MIQIRGYPASAVLCVRFFWYRYIGLFGTDSTGLFRWGDVTQSTKTWYEYAGTRIWTTNLNLHGMAGVLAMFSVLPPTILLPNIHQPSAARTHAPVRRAELKETGRHSQMSSSWHSIYYVKITVDLTWEKFLLYDLWYRLVFWDCALGGTLYGVATISRLLKIMGLSCKRTL